jgi:hypothetical protein
MENYSLLRYVLRYLQWDHGIPALTFLGLLLLRLEKKPDLLSSFKLVDGTPELDQKILRNGDWMRFFDEMAGFIRDRFSVDLDSALRTALAYNHQVMPDPNTHYPKVLDLEHDFVSYFRDNCVKSKPLRKLREYPPSSVHVSDPLNISGKLSGYRFDKIASLVNFELQNPLIRPHSKIEAIHAYWHNRRIRQSFSRHE